MDEQKRSEASNGRPDIMSATSSSTPNMGPTVVPPTADDNLKELSSSGGEAAISATPSRPSASGTSKSEHTTPSSFDGRDIELAQSLAVKSLLSFSEYNTELPRDSLFMKWAEEISKIKPKLLNVEGKATTETLIPLLDDTRGPLDLLGRLNFLKNFVYQTLGIRARLYEGSHLIAGMCIWFIYLLWAKPPISNLVSVIFSPAYAQTDGLPLSLRAVLVSLFSVSISVVLIISAYAAMIRKPPLEAGREFLKLTLAFASGFVSTAIAIH